MTGDLKFIDSLCFIPAPLASFPTTFGLTELKKGFFPHLFNTAANQEYVGPIPPAAMYDPEGMSKSKKKEFETWYADQVRNEVSFNLKEEMEAYCVSDVKLLKAGCLQFQNEFAAHAAFRPMEKCVTIASACNRYWRKMMLPRQTIAVEPPSGWHGATTNQSVKALKWLKWQNHRLVQTSNTPQADRIKHVGNEGEVTVRTPAKSYVVDGFDPLTNTVYEFHGCLWHGCTKCFPDRHLKSIQRSDRTFQELYEATTLKEKLLFEHGYNVVIIWECEWDLKVKTDEDLKAYLSTLELVPPLNPRDAFFGGRTNAATLYYKATEGEQIRYVDVTSLYPWVNKYA